MFPKNCEVLYLHNSTQTFLVLLCNLSQNRNLDQSLRNQVTRFFHYLQSQELSVLVIVDLYYFSEGSPVDRLNQFIPVANVVSQLVFVEVRS